MHMSDRRWATGGTPRALLAALILWAGWLVTAHPVPIYDGLGLPDEPYRYVQAPAGAKHADPPTIGIGGVEVTHGVTNGFLNVFTGETGPQATVNLPEGGMSARGGPVSVQLMPLAPSDEPPGMSTTGTSTRCPSPHLPVRPI